MKILLIVLFLCIIAGFFLYEKRRGDELAQFAQQAGFSLKKGQQLRSILLQHPGWVVESRGNQWLFYQPDQRTNSRAITGWLDEIHQFLEQAGAQAYGSAQ
jgi:hypothetical protein